VTNAALNQRSARRALMEVFVRNAIRDLRAERAALAGNDSTGQNQPPTKKQK